MSLSERDSRVVWHPFTQPGREGDAIAIERGEKELLYAEDGKVYIDAVSSWWVNLHGHAHPYIAGKVSEQLNTLEHVIFAGFTHRPAVELAERLLVLLPGNPSKIFYSDNGSTSTEVALKIAIQYWHNLGTPRRKIVAFESAYHGDTFGAMSAGARGVFNAPYHDFLFEVIHIPPPLSPDGGRAAEMLSGILTGDDVAAFIFEPLVQGAAGMKFHSAEGLSVLTGMCREKGVITIADEVFTGFGRTGRLFASEYLNAAPDIICLSKGITGGTMPLAATSVTAEIYSAFVSEERSKMLLHGHSYTANPLACAAAGASLDLLSDPASDRQRRMIAESQRGFIQALSTHEKVRNARQLGTIAAFETGIEGEEGYMNPLRDRLYRYFLERGVLLRPLGNTVYIVPPYCISADNLKAVYGAIFSALDDII